MATLIAFRTGATKLVTIGSPRVGDEEFARAFDAANLAAIRIVGAADVVTRIPPAAFGYRHVGQGAFIDPDGRQIAAPTAGQVDADVDLARLVDYVAHEGQLPRELSDHAPINYLRAFWPSGATGQ